jgi:hypothetical protein
MARPSRRWTRPSRRTGSTARTLASRRIVAGIGIGLALGIAIEPVLK